MIKNKYAGFIVVLTILLIAGCSSQSKVVASAMKESEKISYIAQGENTGPYWPTNGWKTCAPETVGMDAQKLDLAMAYATNPKFKTEGILVVKDGYIISEAYIGSFTQDSEHISNSMAKSFSSALVGIAIDKGLIANIDERICQYYETWDCADPDDLRSKITLRHAMTLTTGLEWKEDWSTWNYKTNDALKMALSGYFTEYMSQRKGLYEPGTHFLYSTGDPMLLSKVIQQATGMSAFEFAQQQIFKPLNFSKVRWNKDEDAYTATSHGLYTTTRDYAKFGFLFLNKGQWEDQQIVSEKWVEHSTQTDPSVNMWKAYGYLWHVNLPLRLSGKKHTTSTDAIPADGYMAEGVLGQNIIIIPSKNLMIVKVANQKTQQIDLAKLITLVINADKGE